MMDYLKNRGKQFGKLLEDKPVQKNIWLRIHKLIQKRREFGLWKVPEKDLRVSFQRQCLCQWCHENNENESQDFFLLCFKEKICGAAEEQQIKVIIIF